MGSGGRGVTAACQHLEPFAGSNMMFMLIVSFSLPQNPLEIIFCMFGDTLLYLCSFFSGLQLHATSRLPDVVTLMYVRYRFFVLFVTLKTNSVQAQVCISLTDPWEITYSCCGLQCQPSAPSHVAPCQYSSIVHPGSPFLKTSTVFSRPVFLYTSSLYQSCKYLILHKISSVSGCTIQT